MQKLNPNITDDRRLSHGEPGDLNPAAPKQRTTPEHIQHSAPPPKPNRQNEPGRDLTKKI
jgi:hypothetical protein